MLVIYLLSSATLTRRPKGRGRQRLPATITSEDRLKADVEALRKKLEKLENEKGQPSKKEPAKEAKTDTVPGIDQEKPESLKELEKMLRPGSHWLTSSLSHRRCCATHGTGSASARQKTGSAQTP